MRKGACNDKMPPGLSSGVDP
jgi:hypothetical protein